MGADFYLTQGDCLSCLELLPSHCVDLIVVDPGPLGRMMKTGPKRIKVLSLAPEQVPTLLYALARVLKASGVCWWVCEGAQTFQVVRWAEAQGFCPGTPLVWDRGPESPIRMGFVVPLCVGKARSPGEEFVLAPRPQGAECWPGQLPEALVEALINASTTEGQMVLDPFLGAGTVGKVALGLGRRFIGIDKLEASISETHRHLSGLQVNEGTWQQLSDIGSAGGATPSNPQKNGVAPSRNGVAQLSIFGDGLSLR